MVLLLLSIALIAQSAEETVRSNLASMKYPLLAEQARVQGVVHVKIESGRVTLLSGHPLLAPSAIANSDQLTSILGNPYADLTYHFVLTDSTTTVRRQRTVKRGNALTRRMFRVIGVKTEKVIQESVCENVPAAPPRIEADGKTIHVWIHGRSLCFQPDVSTLVAQR